MTEYPDHLAIARQLLEQQGEINRLTADLEEIEIAFEQRGQTITRLEGKLQATEMQLAELNNAITWETTCLNCSRLLTRSYGDYCRAEALTAAVLAVSNGLTQPGVHDAAGQLSDALDRHQETASDAPVFPLPIRPDGTHHYVSTYCVHGQHGDCRRVCKCCPSACSCDCGHPAPEGMDDEGACECGHYRTSHRGSARFGSTCDMCAVLRVGHPYHPFTARATVVGPATGSEEQR